MQHFVKHGSPEHIANLMEYIRGLEAEIRRLGGDPNLIAFADRHIVIDSFGRPFVQPGS